MLVLRWILFPFSLLYGLIVEVRNWFFDWGCLSSYSIPKHSISVGNLSTGGTGKTPHVHYLAAYLKQTHQICIVSRGYGRKTKGFRWVEAKYNPEQVGDEPLFYKTSFGSEVLVAVGEKRSDACRQVLNEFPSTDLFLLDDAFQHRAVKCGLSILLTEYNKPFFNDYVLPSGNLREFRHNKNRADLLIVTKCPESLSDEQKKRFHAALNFGEKPVFFSKIVYGEPVSFSGFEWKSPEQVLLVTGIANPEPLIAYLSASAKIEHIRFPDHHDFKEADIAFIHRKFDTFAHGNAAILTTEKDFVRLSQIRANGGLKEYPWCYLPISIQLDEEEKFKSIIDQYVGTI